MRSSDFIFIFIFIFLPVQELFSEMEMKKKKMRMNVVLLLMATILADPCSAYLSPDFGNYFGHFLSINEKYSKFLSYFLLIAEIHYQASL
jgi:hypothetical protein